MTLPEPGKRFESARTAQSALRPKIWIEGRQRPQFGLKAYAATVLGMAKRDLIPAMLEAEGRLRGLGRRVANGEMRVKPGGTGRLQRALPSQQRVGGWILGLAQLFADSRNRLDPAATDDAELACPNLVRGGAVLTLVRPKPTGVVKAAQVPKSPDEPTLHAIRSAISLAPHDAGLEPRRHGSRTQTIAVGPVARETGARVGLVATLKKSLWRAQCRVLLGVLIPFAIPGGAIKALLFHLNGGDLGDWS